jgi:RNA polymerase sigma-70 factor (ECF subfamily)
VTAEPEYATPEEAAEALEKLGQADRLRIESLARNRLYGNDSEWEDLLQEALTRILEGTRRWPRDLPIVAFIAGVMRSLASERRKQRRYSSEEEASQVADGNPGPEQQAAARAEIQALENHFGDDDEALEVLMGKFDGLTPAEIQTIFDLTKTQYDSTLKRIRRKIEDYKKKKGAEL